MNEDKKRSRSSDLPHPNATAVGGTRSNHRSLSRERVSDLVGWLVALVFCWIAIYAFARLVLFNEPPAIEVWWKHG